MLFLKLLYYISFIMIFFTSSVIFIIPNTGANFYTGLIFWILFFFIFLFFKYKYIINLLNKLIKIKIFNYYLLFQFVILFTSLIHIFLGYYKAPVTYYIVRVKDFLIVTTFIYLIPIMSQYLKISLKQLMKLIYLIFYILLIIGIIQFFAFLYNIDIIYKIIDNIANIRFANHIGVLDAPRTELRIYSLFTEPAAFASFIFMLMPLIYNLTVTKYTIVKNLLINKFIKITMLPLTLLCVILTKSPIYLILCFVEYIILVIIHRKVFIKKIFVPLIFIIPIIFLLFINTINNEINNNPFLYRIISAISCNFSLQSLAILEPSLATRIISYKGQLYAFSKNIFWGVGLYNIESYLNNIFLQTSNVFTVENLIKYYNTSYIVSLNKNFCFTLLAETGLFGVFSYLLFCLNNFIIIHKIKTKLHEINKVIANGIFQSSIAIFFLSIYGVAIDNPIPWFINGLILLIVYKYNKYLKVYNENSNCK